MSKTINISAAIHLPMSAVTQTLACIGRKGAGKTYLAGVIAEQMLDEEAQIVVIDPVGNWWGLRIASDGTGKGKEIFIAGGEHGDVPLLPDSGARFARLVVEKNISIILDASAFRQGERKRFAADFAEEFFHLKKSQRSAVHLFVEEAQLFAPQRTGPDEARMLGAFENIIRLGRNYGIGATLITQRPQSVNKEVLSQVECLCVLQVNGTHERKALEEWIQEAGADRKLVGELPGLAQGEGYVWSPSWLRTFQKVRFAKKTTFNASATPEVGKTVRAGKLTPVDVDVLREDLKHVIEEAAKDDPKALRKRIAELEGELKRKPTVDQSAIDALNQQLDSKDTWARACARSADSCGLAMTTAAGKLEEIALDLRMAAGQEKLESQMPVKAALVTPRLKPQSQWPKPTLPTPQRNGNSNGNLRAGARRMLACLCQWMPAGRTEAQLAAQVQMKRTGGTWAAYKSDLRNGGYIEIRGDGLWYATEAGREFLGADIPDTPTTTDEVVQLWGQKLRKGAREMLDVLVQHRGGTVSRDHLGAEINMEPSGGTFAAYLSDLKQAGLIIVDRDGVRANEETLLL